MPALVLLDEVGSGTDPVEGGALGVAVVDHFRRRGATVIATSHYDALKTYASTTEGVASAAFGFDADTFAPTYQLVYGSPGRSLALEIAGRLGLNPSVVAAARQNLARARRSSPSTWPRSTTTCAPSSTSSGWRRASARRSKRLEPALRQREEALRQREETFRRRLTEELDAQVRRARREIDEVIADAQGEDRRRSPQDAARQAVSHRRGGRRPERGARRASTPWSDAFLEPSTRSRRLAPRTPQVRAAGGRRPRARRRPGPRRHRHRRFTTAPRISTCAASGCAPACAT